MPSLSDEQLEDLQSAFRMADADGDGQIDAAEFEHFADDMGMQSDQPSLRPMFRDIDRDHDGLINLDEFVQWWTTH